MPELTSSMVAGLAPQLTAFEVRDSRVIGFFVRVQPTGASSFYVTWKRGRKRRIGSTTVLSVGRARVKAKQILAEVATGGNAAKPASAPTLRRFLNELWLPWARHSVRTWNATHTRWMTNGGKLLSTPLDEITPAEFEAWRVLRLQKKLKGGREMKPGTVNRDRNDLIAFLNRAVTLGVVETNPLHNKTKSIKDDNTRVRYLTDEQEAALLRSCDPVILPHVVFAMNTGLRRGEQRSVDWADVSDDLSRITISGSKAKSGKTRHIPLNATARGILVPIDRRVGLVFGKASVQRWQNALERAEIEDFKWHDLRHHFASKLVREGVAITAVQSLLGHATLTMTLRYAHLAPGHLVSAVDAIG